MRLAATSTCHTAGPAAPWHGGMQAVFRVFALFLLTVALAGCSATLSRNALPITLTEEAQIGLGENFRFWGDEPAPEAITQEILEGRRTYAQTREGPPKYLTISGGGHNGAFGAGYLLGWTARGDRPTFDVVSGVSIGAMIAPMAFLGTAYDQKMQTVFARLAVERDRGPGILGAMFGAPAVESNGPLKRAIEELIDWQTVTAIAREHDAGRHLFVGTTNLDAERPVIWNIGAIATSGLPNRVELIRQIILASASIPGVFPPVMIDVRAAGAEYDEMHVDGGVTQNVLLFSGTFDVLAGGSRGAELYVIYNGQVSPGREVTGTTTIDVVSRAVPTMLKYQGRADLNMLRAAAEENGVRFRVTAVDPAYPETLDLFPGADWLSRLFEYGYEAGRTGQWSETF